MKLVGRYPPRSEAQDLMWDAMEVIFDDSDKAEQLCRRALKIYPDCVDALAMLAQLTEYTPIEFVESMRQAVEAGRRDLGKKFFRENTGIFWGLVETRPFMRSMEMLAGALLECGGDEAVDEVITVYEEMIELNPDDNQGVRDGLASCYLQRKRYDDAEKLFQRYPEDWGVISFWAKIIHAFATDGPEAAAKLLPEAHERNEHVVKYLTGRKRRPRNRDAFYTVRHENEAVYCADILWEAWKKHPKAKKWLKKITDPGRQPPE